MGQSTGQTVGGIIGAVVGLVWGGGNWQAGYAIGCSEGGDVEFPRLTTAEHLHDDAA